MYVVDTPGANPGRQMHTNSSPTGTTDPVFGDARVASRTVVSIRAGTFARPAIRAYVAQQIESVLMRERASEVEAPETRAVSLSCRYSTVCLPVRTFSSMVIADFPPAASRRLHNALPRRAIEPESLPSAETEVSDHPLF